MNSGNRVREVLRGTNCKNSYPWKTGDQLRRGYAVVRVPDADIALAAVFEKRPGANSSFKSGISPTHLAGVPDLTALDAEHIWLAGIVTGADEMQRIVSRLLPSGEIIESDYSASFADKWRNRDVAPRYAKQKPNESQTKGNSQNGTTKIAGENFAA